MYKMTKRLMQLCLISILAVIPYTEVEASEENTNASVNSSEEISILGIQRRQARRQARRDRRQDRRDCRRGNYEEQSRQQYEKVQEETMEEEADEYKNKDQNQ